MRATIRIRVVKNYTPWADPILPVLTAGEVCALDEWLARCLIEFEYAIQEER